MKNLMTAAVIAALTCTPALADLPEPETPSSSSGGGSDIGPVLLLLGLFGAALYLSQDDEGSSSMMEPRPPVELDQCLPSPDIAKGCAGD